MSAPLAPHRSTLPAHLSVAVAGVASWLTFAWAWWRVTETDSGVSTETLAALAGCALVVVAVDLWWVEHNRRIYRAKGPRRGRPHLDEPIVVDSLGRPLLISKRAERASEVVVAVTGTGTKTYRAARQP